MVRVGAGTGYYMVIMAHLVFSTDKVLLSYGSGVARLGWTVVQGDGRCAVISRPADLM